jgi:T-complex protein 1 subunit beta
MDPEAQVDKGESARFSSFMGAIAIADLVKTTLGPKGMDKILQSVSNPNGDIMVTNDGATILRSIVVDNPAAKVLIDIAKTQDDEVGDGTTSVTVLAGELLREAEKLIQLRIHPMVIIDGWRKATAIARAALEASSLDHGSDPVAFRADLMNIARTSKFYLFNHYFNTLCNRLTLTFSPSLSLLSFFTALSSKLLTHEKDQFAQLAVDAVMRIKNTLNLEQIQIIKRSGGSLKVRN